MHERFTTGENDPSHTELAEIFHVLLEVIGGDLVL
jgi:hypothetical protein